MILKPGTRFGAVAAGHKQTANAAAAVLKNGGNAFDAALAALLCSTLTETCMSSMGGGALAAFRTSDGKTGAIDFFCQTPRKKKQPEALHFYPHIVHFGDSSEVFHVGLGAMATPGMPAGIMLLHKTLCKIPLPELAAFALDVSKNGALVDEFQQLDFELLEGMLFSTPEGKKMFSGSDGKLFRAGDTMYLPQLGDFIDYLSRHGSDEFYLGEPARKTSEASRLFGGHLSMEDFVNYRPILRHAHAFEYFNHHFYTVPPPALGGIILENLIKNECWYSADRQSLVKRYSAVINSGKNCYTEKNKRGNTSHLSVTDKGGNSIAITMTNGEGCGFVIPDTQIMMNNMLGESMLMPAGFHSWVPDVRLASMMTPVICHNPLQNVTIAAGTGGAGRIPYMLAQFFRYLQTEKLSLEKAIEAPRLHFQEDSFQVEPGLEFPDALLENKANLVRWKQKNLYFGGINAVQNIGGNFTSHGDSRRWGVGITIDN